ncbi:MAG: NHLP bacteriocin export ABC transporter permease/ATPase subunit [Clostridiales bacterium]|nr:NHLP bacteriocin export ABC transporter permease/ATPase subunit [Clostridiales bacterium]
MSWFDEQIKTRMQNDQESLENAYLRLSSVVMGRSVLAAALKGEREKAQNAIEEILRFYHVKKAELPSSVTELEDILEYLMRPSGIMRRNVELTGDWYRNGIGPLLGHTAAGDVIALIPDAVSGYRFTDYETGKTVKVTAKNKDTILPEAICFYKPLPLRAIGVKELMQYILGTLSGVDFLMVAAATLAVTLLGMILPEVNAIVFSQLIPSGKASLVLPMACMLVGVTISSALAGVVRTLLLTRITTKMGTAVSAAAMARVLSLPVAFFKQFSSGELAQRTNQITQLCQMLVDTFLTTGLTSVFSLVYIGQIFSFAPALAVPAIVILLGSVVFSFASVWAQLHQNRRAMNAHAKLSGLVFGLFTGVQTIKLSGAEKRAFAQWARVYQEYAAASYAPPLLVKLSGLIPAVITMAGTIVFYSSAVASGVSAADYMAFNTSYGMLSGAVGSLAAIAYTMARIKPTLEMVEPILRTAPEVSGSKRVVEKLSGAIELSNVSFRYSPDTPLIIDNLSLKIRAGQYVAIVGKTGCGKSTLMRLLLGFETPQKGAVYYDGKDIDTLDLKSLRRNIGVVMQNGRLFQGDLYSNIAVSAPGLSMEDAMKAAEAAGMGEDIRRMPMGLHTIVSEGGGGISGGQRQRLMIARAIAPKPKILMFDEATSALDNLTQKQVSESLDSLKCTRIVIAHRLSTIRQCDRIIVLDKGRIVEDGTYEQLIAQGGYFAELVERQRLDNA